MKVATIINSFVLASIVGVGAYHIDDAQANQMVTVIAEDEVQCLRQNIYFEARNQSVLGQAAVAWVTLNRVTSSRYPESICEVVWQDGAFSWTHDGKPDLPSDNVLEVRAWNKALDVAKSVLFDWVSGKSSPVQKATMFHADYVSPYWKSSYDKVVKIDAHIFYE